MNPAFHSPPVFVLYVGMRQAVTVVKHEAIAAKLWSDGSEAVECGAMAPLLRGVNGESMAPVVNHALAIQGDEAQLTSCATTLYIGDCEGH